MKFAVQIALTVLLFGLGAEAGRGVVFCLNAPSDLVFIAGLATIPVLTFAGVRWLDFIWRY